MRRLMFIVAIITVSCANGADVLWNALQLTKFNFGNYEADPEYSLGWHGSGSVASGITGTCSLEVYIILTSYEANVFRVTSEDHDDTVTSVTANWIQADSGERANATTTRNRQSYFNHCHLDHETGWENLEFTTEAGADFYLMFAVGSTKEYNDNIPNPNCLYGWALLEIDTNGELELKRSAIGLDGQEMIVGAIPEPSSALLVLFGCAGLALKRRRLLFQCHRGHKHSGGEDGQ